MLSWKTNGEVRIRYVCVWERERKRERRLTPESAEELMTENLKWWPWIWLGKIWFRGWILIFTESCQWTSDSVPREPPRYIVDHVGFDASRLGKILLSIYHYYRFWWHRRMLGQASENWLKENQTSFSISSFSVPDFAMVRKIDFIFVLCHFQHTKWRVEV